MFLVVFLDGLDCRESVKWKDFNLGCHYGVISIIAWLLYMTWVLWRIGSALLLLWVVAQVKGVVGFSFLRERNLKKLKKKPHQKKRMVLETGVNGKISV